jgi:hypothetical protein
MADLYDNKLNQSLMTINEPDMARLIEQLRSMEKDLLPIYTYFKNAVYTTNKDESSTNRPPLYD